MLKFIIQDETMGVTASQQARCVVYETSTKHFLSLRGVTKYTDL